MVTFRQTKGCWRKLGANWGSFPWAFNRSFPCHARRLITHLSHADVGHAGRTPAKKGLVTNQVIRRPVPALYDWTLHTSYWEVERPPSIRFRVAVAEPVRLSCWCQPDIFEGSCMRNLSSEEFNRFSSWLAVLTVTEPHTNHPLYSVLRDLVSERFRRGCRWCKHFHATLTRHPASRQLQFHAAFAEKVGSCARLRF